MIDPTFQSFPLYQLRALGPQLGTLARRDSRRARALCRDEFPDHPLQVELLGGAIDAGVPAALAAAGTRGAVPIEVGRLAMGLVNRFGFQEYMARWAVAAWAYALGFCGEEDVSTTLAERAVQDSAGVSGAPTAPDTAPPPSRPPAAGTAAIELPPSPGSPEQAPVASRGSETASTPPDDRQVAGSGGFPPRLIAGGLVAAMIIAIGAGVVATRAFGPGPKPTPTLVSTATPSPTPVPSPTIAPATVERMDVSMIRSRGYIAKTKLPAFAFTPDGNGRTLYAWVGTCADSADGYCQKVFFFDGTRFVGNDTTTASAGIDSIEADGDSVIDVTYANYKKTDPLCCPSGLPVTIGYTWNGTTMTGSGTPPGH